MIFYCDSLSHAAHQHVVACAFYIDGMRYITVELQQSMTATDFVAVTSFQETLFRRLIQKTDLGDLFQETYFGAGACNTAVGVNAIVMGFTSTHAKVAAFGVVAQLLLKGLGDLIKALSIFLVQVAGGY